MIFFKQDLAFADRRIFSRLAVIALCIGLASEGHSHSVSQNATKDPDKMTPNIECAMRSGRRMLLVELYGATTYVFDSTHEVAGPVIEVLGSFGFELVLPAGVVIPAEGLLAMPAGTMHTAQPDHVFLMNFSKDETAVQRVIFELGAFSENRVYRMNSTVAEAFSKEWNADLLRPMVAKAIEQTSTGKNDL
ncbi:hypothetical protein AGR4B_pAt10022 [Agrobacterium tumefaciens str. CFBP 5621]|uniref:hypothetical protein n=1 Tax=Agrobacterium tumefaciens TaxID=358 RepID=UPI0009B93250|nr:hypothetical protein [Agrobacterium tumefaciens]CUX51164.1 hypothetical protein AGR4B_pAt10022 [Agrobacterium tumefaciens str. CFBP 5621]